MSDLIAIGYPDQTTALKAEKEAQRLASELIIQPDAIAAIVRDKDGKFRVTTNHHPVGGGASYGMFWGLLFGLLFFVPVFGMAIGAGLGALMAKVEKFRHRPGVSGAGERPAPARDLGALPHRRKGHARPGSGGTQQVRRHRAQVVPCRRDAEAELQEELHGSKEPVAV